MFEYQSLRKNLFISSLLLFMTNYTYFGSVFAMGTLKGDLFTNTLILTFVDLFGFISIDFVSSKVERKTFFFISYIMVIMTLVGFYLFELPDNCNGCYQ